jgi:hypothetical protein
LGRDLERFDIGVVDRLARSAEIRRHAGFIGPTVQGVRDELRAVVETYALGRTPLQDDPPDDIGHIVACDALIDFDCQSLAREHVEQRQSSKPTPVEQSIRHEVHRPNLVWPIHSRSFDPMRGADMSSGPPNPQIQAFLAIEPTYALVVHGQSLPSQNDMNPAITEANPRRSDLPNAVSKKSLIVAFRPVPMCRPIEPRNRATATLADPISLLQSSDQLAATIRLQSFERTTSCSMTLSRLRSANSCFSLRFSSSSCFSRRTSATPMPPYIFFQR